MNAFEEASLRVEKRKVIKAFSLGYDGIVQYYSDVLDEDEIRPREEYDKALAICRECSPSGRCEACFCPYESKLVMIDFECAKGNF
jgi:hypothetical protein